MTLTPEQKEHAIDLIAMGDKLDAVRYFQQTLGITTEEALLLAEKLEEEIEGEESDLLKEFKSLEQEALKHPGMNVGRVVGTIFMSLGCIMLVVAAYLLFSNYKFTQRAVSVKGKVIDYSSYLSTDDDGRSTMMYTPTYQYNFKGKSYTHISTTSTSSQDYEINEPIEMLVDPLEPSEILIKSFMGQWFLSLLLGIMGVMFTGMGYMAYAVLGKPN